MTNQRYTTFEQNIPANSDLTIPVVGNSVRCFSSNFNFKIAFDEEPPSDMLQGIGIQIDNPFSKVRIINPDQVNSLVVNLGFASGEISDSRTTISGALKVKSGDNIETLPAVDVGTSAIVLDTGDNDGSRLWLQNNSDEILYVGDASVSVASGMVLRPEQTLIMETGAAAYAIAESTGNNVRIMREKF